MDKYKSIDVISYPRSGTTLVYNILKNLFPFIKVTKSGHDLSILKKIDPNILYVIPVRNLYNTIASITELDDRDVNEETLVPITIFNKIKNSYSLLVDTLFGNIDNFISLTSCPHVILLNYDKFVNNYDYIYQILETKLNITIDINIKQLLYNSVNRTATKKFINDLNLQSFKEYDPQTQLHGNHISKYNGNTDYNTVFSEVELYHIDNLDTNDEHGIGCIKQINDFINTIDELNSTLYKKTVVQVITLNEKIAIEPLKHRYNGIGDIMRGCLSMYKLSKELNFKLVIDMSTHDISKYLKQVPHEYNEIVNENINKIPFIYYYENLKYFIKNNKNDIMCLYSNSIYNDDNTYIYTNVPITSDESEFMKKYFTPNDILNYHLNQQILLKTNNYGYNILHFRLLDKYHIKGKNSESALQNLDDTTNTSYVDANSIIDVKELDEELKIKFEELENIFTMYYEKGDIFITNNILFKKYISDKYSCICFDIIPSHSGIELANETTLLHNMFELFLQTRCKTIKTYSDYKWISGFSNAVASIYNIPTVIMRGKKIIVTDELRINKPRYTINLLLEKADKNIKNGEMMEAYTLYTDGLKLRLEAYDNSHPDIKILQKKLETIQLYRDGVENTVNIDNQTDNQTDNKDEDKEVNLVLKRKINEYKIAKYSEKCSTYLHYVRIMWDEVCKQLNQTTDKVKIRDQLQKNWNALPINYKSHYTQFNNTCPSCYQYNFNVNDDDNTMLYHNQLIIKYINTNKNENCSAYDHYLRAMFDEISNKLKDENPYISRQDIITEIKTSFNLLSDQDLNQLINLSKYCIKCNRKLQDPTLL